MSQCIMIIVASLICMGIIYIVNDMMIMYCVFLQDGTNALMLAAVGGHCDVVEFITNQYPSMMTRTNNVSKQISSNMIIIMMYKM